MVVFDLHKPIISCTLLTKQAGADAARPPRHLQNDV